MSQATRKLWKVVRWWAEPRAGGTAWHQASISPHMAEKSTQTHCFLITKLAKEGSQCRFIFLPARMGVLLTTLGELTSLARMISGSLTTNKLREEAPSCPAGPAAYLCHWATEAGQWSWQEGASNNWYMVKERSWSPWAQEFSRIQTLE